MKRFILTLIAVSLLGTLSFAGVAKESAKAGKFAGKKAGHGAVKVLKFGKRVLY